jgi:hypothetical protein
MTCCFSNCVQKRPCYLTRAACPDSIFVDVTFSWETAALCRARVCSQRHGNLVTLCFAFCSVLFACAYCLHLHGRSLLLVCLVCSSTLNMEAEGSSETPANYQSVVQLSLALCGSQKCLEPGSGCCCHVSDLPPPLRSPLYRNQATADALATGSSGTRSHTCQLCFYVCLSLILLPVSEYTSQATDWRN